MQQHTINVKRNEQGWTVTLAQRSWLVKGDFDTVRKWVRSRWGKTFAMVWEF